MKSFLFQRNDIDWNVIHAPRAAGRGRMLLGSSSIETLETWKEKKSGLVICCSLPGLIFPLSVEPPFNPIAEKCKTKVSWGRSS